MRIRDLPYQEKHDICKILGLNNCIYELGVVHMQFEEKFIQSFIITCKKTGVCPIERLLDEWDTYGHTVMELFIILYRMKLYPAMKVLKPFIPLKHHRLIKDESNVVKTEKILNALPENTNVASCDDNITNPPQNHLNLNGMTSTSSTMESAGAIPQIPYEELQHATNNWDTANILGKGGFGMVFKGTWKCTQVAIKRIERREDSPDSSYQQILQSNTELHCLNAYRHDNILPLYGYSVGGGGRQPCLIYQFMPGGSLDTHLHSRSPRMLQWTTRLNIAIGTARGLQFLHTIREKPLIHGDIKSANILLDLNQNPRIGDFGLAKEGPASDYIQITRIHGTRPYLPVEFIKFHKFSTKVDTYSFGVVLFELATGAGPYSSTREDRFLRDYVMNKDESRIMELKDARVPRGEDVFERIIQVGKQCVDLDHKKRPEMVDALIMLEKE